MSKKLKIIIISSSIVFMAVIILVVCLFINSVPKVTVIAETKDDSFELVNSFFEETLNNMPPGRSETFKGSDGQEIKVTKNVAADGYVIEYPDGSESSSSSSTTSSDEDTKKGSTIIRGYFAEMTY